MSWALKRSLSSTGEAHALALEHLAEFLEIVPAQVSAEMLVEIIDSRHVGIGEQRRGARRLNHIHQDQVLVGNEVDAADKAFGQHRIIQRGEEYNERPPPQPQPDEAAHFVVVGINAARLECIDRVAAGVVVRFSIPRAHEGFHPVGKCQEAETDRPAVRRRGQRRAPR